MYLSSYLNNMEGSSNLNNLNNLSNSFDDYANNTFDDNLILNGVRSRKKNIENPCCPVCSCTIRNNELENHFSVEIEKLNKISGNIGTKRKLSNGSSIQSNMMSMAGSSSASQTQVPEEADVDVTGCVGSEVFQRVRQNRQRRLRTRARARLTSTSDTGECPVCGRRLPRRRLQRHALRCLRKTGGALPGDDDDELLETSSSEEGSIDVEGDDPMDAAEQPGSSFGAEYQWCGQWRVRAAALQAREAPPPSPHVSALRRASNDTTLVVDGDEDTELYGPPQYSPSRIAPDVVDGDEDTELYGPPQYSPSRIAPDCEETPSTSRDQQLVNSTHSGGNERESATDYGGLGVNDAGSGINDGRLGINDGHSGNNVGRSGIDDRGSGIDDRGLEINDGQSQSISERGSADNEVELGHIEDGSGLNQRGFGNNGMEFGLNLSLRSPSSGLETKGRGSHAAAAQVRISALMSRVRELEERQESGNEVKCLICLAPYVSPAVSIQCWHVHCETCWMDALRAKKICPQCNAITSTQHLRRVYM